MSLPYAEISIAGQTAYAELFEVTRAQDLRRNLAHLTGRFARKIVKGHLYWYYQYRDLDQSVRQLYVGPDSARLRELVAASDQPDTRLDDRARALIALGGQPVLSRHFRILRRLSEYRFFAAGGVLVGTHAFLSHGNQLGVRWRDGASTHDVDLAHAGRNISIALPATVQVDVHSAIDSLEMGFLPISALDGAAGATCLTPKDPGLCLDFLTTRSRDDEPYRQPDLNVIVQPLRFMDYLLEGTTQAALFSPQGSILVNLPDPARYAVHKLVVFAERSPRWRTKANKDLVQAAAIVSYYREHRRSELVSAWDDLFQRGPGWRRRARSGLAALAKLAPELGVRELLRTR